MKEQEEETRMVSPHASEDARTAATALPVSHWQPMETAPKEPGHILAVDRNGNRSIYFWREMPNIKGWWCATGHYGHFATNLTQWMPLPDPPALAALDPGDPKENT